MVFAMVVVGGITRLTHSGLSIVEWQPIVGTIPPLDDGQWAATFDKYKATPEYVQRNHDMTLEGFKGIFWWEYFHRLLGRLIGIVFLLPWLFFIATRRLQGPLAWKLAGIFLLGGLQGAVGWYMVKSGLVDDPRVSSVRLAMHLGLALTIYALLFDTALGLLRPDTEPADPRARRIATAMVGLVFVMALTGAFVAAIHAGFAYNTWPLMAGRWIPPEVLMLDPWWQNFLNNMATVQLVHRVLAYVVVATAIATWATVRRLATNDRARSWSHALLAMAFIQASIGIATLLHRAPIPLAALHQAGAVLLFTCALGVRHALRAARGQLQR